MIERVLRGLFRGADIDIGDASPIQNAEVADLAADLADAVHLGTDIVDNSGTVFIGTADEIRLLADEVLSGFRVAEEKFAVFHCVSNGKNAAFGSIHALGKLRERHTAGVIGK